MDPMASHEPSSVVELAEIPRRAATPSNSRPHPSPARASSSKTDETPLPKLQLSLLLYIQLAEPITATVIYPFVNQLVRETGITGGDERKTGYFAGLIVRSSSITCLAGFERSSTF